VRTGGYKPGGWGWRNGTESGSNFFGPCDIWRDGGLAVKHKRKVGGKKKIGCLVEEKRTGKGVGCCRGAKKRTEDVVSSRNNRGVTKRLTHAGKVEKNSCARRTGTT